MAFSRFDASRRFLRRRCRDARIDTMPIPARAKMDGRRRYNHALYAAKRADRASSRLFIRELN